MISEGLKFLILTFQEPTNESVKFCMYFVKSVAFKGASSQQIMLSPSVPYQSVTFCREYSRFQYTTIYSLDNMTLSESRTIPFPLCKHVDIKIGVAQDLWNEQGAELLGSHIPTQSYRWFMISFMIIQLITKHGSMNHSLHLSAIDIAIL